MNDTLKKMDRKNLVKWICVLLVPILIMLIPVQGVFTPALRTFSAITITAILLFAFGLLPNFIVAIALPISYMLLNVAAVSYTHLDVYKRQVQRKLGCPDLFLHNTVYRVLDQVFFDTGLFFVSQCSFTSQVVFENIDGSFQFKAAHPVMLPVFHSRKKPLLPEQIKGILKLGIAGICLFTKNFLFKPVRH